RTRRVRFTGEPPPRPSSSNSSPSGKDRRTTRQVATVSAARCRSRRLRFAAARRTSRWACRSSSLPLSSAALACSIAHPVQSVLGAGKLVHTHATLGCRSGWMRCDPA
ncbi:unnamed protein product, partial [Ectocarpus sp. 12 AP-2014]